MFLNNGKSHRETLDLPTPNPGPIDEVCSVQSCSKSNPYGKIGVRSCYTVNYIIDLWTAYKLHNSQYRDTYNGECWSGIIHSLMYLTISYQLYLKQYLNDLMTFLGNSELHIPMWLLFRNIYWQYLTEVHFNYSYKNMEHSIELSVFHINIHSLNAKYRALSNFLQLLCINFDVNVLTEVWTSYIELYSNIFSWITFLIRSACHRKGKWGRGLCQNVRKIL